jgi:hypothetical protein
MPLMKNIRFLILVGLALASVYLLVSPYIFKQSGVIVSSLDKNVNCSRIKEGDVVSQVGGYFIRSSDDFKKTVKSFKEGDYVTLIINNMPGNCYVGSNGSIGVSVIDVHSTKAIFGMEFQGGVRFVLKPEKKLNQSEMNNLLTILDKRIKNLDLLQGSVEGWGEKINVTILTGEKIGMLTMRGELRGVVFEEIKTQNKTGKLFVGNNSYVLELLENKIKIFNSSYAIGESFRVEGTYFEIKNMTNGSVLFEATFLTNKDVINVLPSETISYNSNMRKYEYSIPVEIKNESSDSFIKIVKKLPVIAIENRNFFNALIRYYFDGELLDQLNIPSDIIDEEIRVFSVIGFADSKNEVLNERTKLYAAMKSGELPEKLEIEYSEQVEAGGKNILIAMLFGILSILLLFPVLIYASYKKVKIGLMLDGFVLLELISMLGLVVINQTYLGVGWLVDSTTFLGLIILMLITSVEMFINMGQVFKSEKYRNVFDKTKYMGGLLIALGICLLFTALRNLGLVLFFGELLRVLLIKPIYASEIKKFG